MYLRAALTSIVVVVSLVNKVSVISEPPFVVINPSDEYSTLPIFVKPEA
jgi:hypothetical protein